jgi:hypothetical protein
VLLYILDPSFALATVKRPHLLVKFANSRLLDFTAPVGTLNQIKRSSAISPKICLSVTLALESFTFHLHNWMKCFNIVAHCPEAHSD